MEPGSPAHIKDRNEAEMLSRGLMIFAGILTTAFWHQIDNALIDALKEVAKGEDTGFDEYLFRIPEFCIGTLVGIYTIGAVFMPKTARIADPFNR